jgi:hypothetical protein
VFLIQLDSRVRGNDDRGFVQRFPSLQTLVLVMSDDHSEVEPPLPIPNRTVKRLSADDSVDYPRESRSSSGSNKQQSPLCEGFVVCGVCNDDRLSVGNVTTRRLAACCNEG